jgi:hypothetical protein
MITLRLISYEEQHYETVVYTALYGCGRLRYVTQSETAAPLVLILELDPGQNTYSVYNTDTSPFYCLGESLFTVSEEEQAFRPPVYYCEAPDVVE